MAKDPFSKLALDGNVPRDQKQRRVVQLGPGLARAPRVQALLNDVYAIAGSELKFLRSQTALGSLDQEDFKKFVAIMDKLPALLREERAGDEKTKDELEKLTPGELKELAGEFIQVSVRSEWNDAQEADEVGEPAQLETGDGQPSGDRQDGQD